MLRSCREEERRKQSYIDGRALTLRNVVRTITTTTLRLPLVRSCPLVQLSAESRLEYSNSTFLSSKPRNVFERGPDERYPGARVHGPMARRCAARGAEAKGEQPR